MQPEYLAELERGFSGERLGPYRRACGGDLAAAMALYQWNAEISAALGTTLGHVEVRLRNALHDELSAWSARRYQESRWYLDPGAVLFAEERDDIAAARRRATRSGRPETPGRVVAELDFGFWRFLLARRYDRHLWHPCLHRVFQRRRRAEVFDAVKLVHDARNRMAHHEPMFNRPLAEVQETALRVAGWICPVTRQWIGERCGVPALLAARPG